MKQQTPKRWLITVLALALVGGLALPVWAGPWGMGGCGLGHGCGMGPGYGRGWQLTPEQAGKAFDLRQKFLNETVDLRRQLVVKQAELSELWRAKEPDQAKIAAKQKEINALRDKLQEKAIPYRLEMRDFCPMGGPGFGPKGGPGPGPGPRS